MINSHAQESPFTHQPEKPRQPLDMEKFRKRLTVRVACCTRPHAIYDTPLPPPRWMDPKQRGEWHKSLQWVAEHQQAMLLGHIDVHGSHWCWRCYHRACLLDLGEQLGYSRIARCLLSLVEHNWLQEVCPQAEEAEQSEMSVSQRAAVWRAVAVHAPSSVVADILSAFRRASLACSRSTPGTATS